MSKLTSLLFLAILIAPSAVRGEPGVTDKEITIGVCNSHGGELKNIGIASEQGAKAYIDYINAKGGIHGRKIRYLTYDDGFVSYDHPGDFQGCFQRLLNDGMFMFMGNSEGGIAATRYARLAQAAKVPAAGFDLGVEELYTPFKRYVFGTNPLVAQTVDELIGHLWDDAHIHRIAFTYLSHVVGNALLDEVNRSLAKRGGSLIATVSAPPTFTMEQLDGNILKLKAANPDVVLVFEAPIKVKYLLKRSKELGLKARWINPLGGGADLFPKDIGAAANGLIFTRPGAPSLSDTDLPTVALFLRQMKKSFPDVQPQLSQLVSFASTKVTMEALERAGQDLTREKFVDAMQTINDYDTGLGPQFKATYTSTNHQMFRGATFFMIRDGKAVVMKDSDWKDLAAQ